MKKIFAVIMCAAVITLLFAGCGAKTADDYYYEPSTESYYYDAESVEYESSGEYAESNSVSLSPSVPSAAPDAGSSQINSDIERKIIRNADISMNSDDAAKTYADILAYAKKLGGYESSCTTNVNEYSSGKSVDISATLKLPPEKLDEFVGKAGDFGTINYSNISANEITATYYDLTTRLASKTAALDSYYGLLAKAESIEEILEIQTRIDDLTEEIEAIKGRLRVYDALVEESTVTLRISEYTVNPPAEKEFEWDSLSASDFGKLIHNGFLGVCNFVWSLLQWLAIILVSALPLLILVGGIVFAVRAIRKKKGTSGKKNENKKAKNDATVVAPDYTENK